MFAKLNPILHYCISLTQSGKTERLFICFPKKDLPGLLFKFLSRLARRLILIVWLSDLHADHMTVWGKLWQAGWERQTRKTHKKKEAPGSGLLHPMTSCWCPNKAGYWEWHSSPAVIFTWRLHQPHDELISSFFPRLRVKSSVMNTPSRGKLPWSFEFKCRIWVGLITQLLCFYKKGSTLVELHWVNTVGGGGGLNLKAKSNHKREFVEEEGWKGSVLTALIFRLLNVFFFVNW